MSSEVVGGRPRRLGFTIPFPAVRWAIHVGYGRILQPSGRQARQVNRKYYAAYMTHLQTIEELIALGFSQEDAATVRRYSELVAELFQIKLKIGVIPQPDPDRASIEEALSRKIALGTNKRDELP